MTEFTEQVAQIRLQLGQTIQQVDERIGADLLKRLPLEQVARQLPRQRSGTPYDRFDDALNASFARLRRHGSESEQLAYQSHLVLEELARSLPHLARMPLAEPIRAAFLDWSTQLLKDLGRAKGRLSLERPDFFHKDLAVASLRMLPTSGCCLFEEVGMSRRQLLTLGPSKLFPALSLMLRHLRGSNALYALHLEDRQWRKLNKAGWEASYGDIAAQLTVSKHIAGLHGDAWFFDPRVARISPAVAYLREIPEQGGARFIDLGETEAASKNALGDKERKRRYEAGEYRPHDYLMVWPRKAMLKCFSGE